MAMKARRVEFYKVPMDGVPKRTSTANDRNKQAHLEGGSLAAGLGGANVNKSKLAVVVLEPRVGCMGQAPGAWSMDLRKSGNKPREASAFGK